MTTVIVPPFGGPYQLTLEPAAAFEPGSAAAVATELSSGARWRLVVQQPIDVTWSSTCPTQTFAAGSPIGCVGLSARDIEFQMHGLWMASHAAFRGIQAAAGQGGLVASSAIPVRRRFDAGCGVEALVEGWDDVELRDGDVVVISEKVAAMAQGRVGGATLLDGEDPKFLGAARRAELAQRVGERVGFDVSATDLLLVDYVDQNTVSLGCHDPNATCGRLARLIAERRGCSVDVLVADSDTGVDQCHPLLGLMTIGATPTGATAGLTIYEALRATAVAEYVRGHVLGVPLVVVSPSERNRHRPAVGSDRPYPGMMHVIMEDRVHRGTATPLYWNGDVGG